MAITNAARRKQAEKAIKERGEASGVMARQLEIQEAMRGRRLGYPTAEEVVASLSEEELATLPPAAIAEIKKRKRRGKTKATAKS